MSNMGYNWRKLVSRLIGNLILYYYFKFERNNESLYSINTILNDVILFFLLRGEV